MKNVQDIYPVSPMQEFMLLHSLSNPTSDTLFNQFVFRIEKTIDPEAFHKAWNVVAASHAALRTAFIWKGVDTPQQVVRQKVDVACRVVDLSDVHESGRDAAIASALAEDRRQGFDFRRAPLMRFLLIRLGGSDWRMVWSSHHLILDRWCIDGLFEQFQAAYRALRQGIAVTPKKSPSYREYIAWVRKQDKAQACRYWTEYLRGFSEPITVNRLFDTAGSGTAARVTRAVRNLDAATTRRVREFAGRHGVTLSCLLQAALMLAINRLTGAQDVLFGVTVSGRPAELAHVEDIVGSFITSLPVRTTMTAEKKVGEWLRELNSAQFASAGYDFLSPAQLRACTTLTSEQPLFDLLMVWLSQTRLEQSAGHAGDLPMVSASEQFATAYPLTLSVIERPDELVLRGDAAAGRQYPIDHLLDAIARSLDDLLALASSDALKHLDGTWSPEHRQPAATSRALAVSAVADEAPVERSGGREGVRYELMEDMLRSEWQRLLDVKTTISADDDFFELGGDSLKASALHARVEGATRKAVPLLALFEASTLAGMAQTLVDQKWPLRAGICVPLNMSGEGPILFCVASPEVNTLGYAMLVRHLPERQNVVLLQAPPSSDSLEQMHPDELSEFAARYVRALRKIQPTGPYLLLSMCSGAHIALDMIRQLEAAGQEVQFAGVINTWSLYSISWKFYVNRLINVTNYYRSRVTQIVQSKLSSATSEEPSLAAGPQATVARPVETLAALPADEAVGLDNPWIKQVGFAHRLPAIPAVDATITVFRLSHQPFWRIRDQALGWSRLASQAHCVDVDGDDHDSILREPYVQHFAERLKEALASAVGVGSNGPS